MSVFLKKKKEKNLKINEELHTAPVWGQDRVGFGNHGIKYSITSLIAFSPNSTTFIFSRPGSTYTSDSNTTHEYFAVIIRTKS